MYKVLIVDDEKMIRMGIKKVIPWNAIGIGEAFTAASSREALEILEKENVDIMITDINMSEMTGIELIGKIRELSRDIRIIVLTGYDNFEYARQCLRLQVADFFLKPIEEEVLTETIRKQVEALERKKESLHREITSRRIQGTAEQLELEKIMKNLVHNRTWGSNTAEVLFAKYRYDKDQSLQIAVFVPELYVKEMIGEENFTALSIKNICIGMVDARNAGITFMDDDGKIIMVFFNQGNENEILERVEQLNNILKDEYSIHPKVVLGSVVKGFYNLMISYNDAIYLLNHEKESMTEIVQPYQSQNRAGIFKDIYQELKASMNSNVANMDYVLHIFDTFCRAAESYNLTVNYIRKCCFEIASSLYFAYLSDSGTNADSKLNELMKGLVHASKEEALEVTKAFLSQISGNEDLNGHELIKQAIRYINENLAQDLTVSGIADSLFVTPNYLSRLFKRVKKEGCNEYIVRKRIEKAKALLENTSIPTGKIAMLVGYHDTNYFSLAFKKHTGMSPTKYRETVREGTALLNPEKEKEEQERDLS